MRFQVSKDEECLTLSMPLDYRSFFVGGSLFLVACFSNLALAVLGIMTQERYAGADADTTGPMSFIDPPKNPFGFLWGVSFLLILIFIPLYALKIRRSSLVYSFHRRLGLFLRNGKEVAPLRRIERLQIRKMVDSDGGHWYRLAILYADGQEIFIEDSYNEEEISDLAYDIADYSNAEVVHT